MPTAKKKIVCNKFSRISCCLYVVFVVMYHADFWCCHFCLLDVFMGIAFV